MNRKIVVIARNSLSDVKFFAARLYGTRPAYHAWLSAEALSSRIDFEAPPSKFKRVFARSILQIESANNLLNTPVPFAFSLRPTNDGKTYMWVNGGRPRT
jgi:hypothetical protein